MPSVSQKQHNLMAMVANDPAAAKRTGVPQSVGKEFVQADKGLKFGKSKKTRADLQKINRPSTDQGKSEFFAKGGEMKKVKKMAFGGGTAPKAGMPNFAKPYADKMMAAQKAAADLKASAVNRQNAAQAAAAQGKQMKFLSDKLRGGAAGTPSMGKPRLGLASMGNGGSEAVRAAGRAAGLMPSKPPSSVMAKKGGLMAGHKSADGIARKGKTKAAKPVMKKSGR